jgi:hypothetical protein
MQKSNPHPVPLPRCAGEGNGERAKEGVAWTLRKHFGNC